MWLRCIVLEPVLGRKLGQELVLELGLEVDLALWRERELGLKVRRGLKPELELEFELWLLLNVS